MVVSRKALAAIRKSQRRAAQLRNAPTTAPTRGVTLKLPRAVRDINVPTPAAPTTSTSTSSSSARPVIKARPAPIQLSGLQAEVLRLLNQEREKAGLVALQPNAQLQRSATLYAADMRDRKFFSHRSPEGEASLDRIRASGYLDDPCDCRWNYVTGENIASGFTSAAEVVRAWMESPSHRENMLHPAFRDIGIGLDVDYWVLHFGVVEVVD